MTRYKSLLILTTIAAILLVSCGENRNNKGLLPADLVQNPVSAEGDTDNDQLPVIEFENDFHDFGKVIQGELVTYGFKFKNTGKSDLIITRVSTSCGCTATEYPQKPVSPGDEGVIKITFNSKGRIGIQRKTATVMANTQPNKTTLTIKAMIFVPEE